MVLSSAGWSKKVFQLVLKCHGFVLMKFQKGIFWDTGDHYWAVNISTTMFLCNRPFLHGDTQPTNQLDFVPFKFLCFCARSMVGQSNKLWWFGPLDRPFSISALELWRCPEILEMSSSKDYGNKSGISENTLSSVRRIEICHDRWCKISASCVICSRKQFVLLLNRLAVQDLHSPKVWFYTQKRHFYFTQIKSHFHQT